MLRQFPDLDFGMDGFEHMLRTQKFVYLMQTFGIYPGYDYSWYLCGPYCTSLATIGFALTKIYDDVPYDKGLVFMNPDMQERFELIRVRQGPRERQRLSGDRRLVAHAQEDERGGPRQNCQEGRRQTGAHRRGALQRHLGGDGAVGSHKVGNEGGLARPYPHSRLRASAAAKSGGHAVRVSIRNLGQSQPDMEQRPVDVGICHMLADAAESGDEIVLVGQNVFREEERHPPIDEIIVPTAGLAEGMARER